MKRVLVLHGHTENAHVFGRKFNDFRDALKGEVEFVFVDAPHLLTPVDPEGAPVFSTSEKFASVRNLDPKHPTKHTPRGWFYHTHDAQDAWAVSQSLMYLRNVLEKQGPFNGIMGYSQGGSMAALVAGLLECPTHTPHFKGIQHPPMEFLVSFSSFIIPNPAFAVPKNLRTPTLLVMGQNDTIVLPEHTHILSQQFCKENIRLVVHEGGHFVPRKPEWRAFLIDLFKAFAGSSASGSSNASALYMRNIGVGSSGAFVPCGGIPYPLLPNRDEEVKKKKAREAITKSRRKSWTEVVPKTIWEGGVDEMDEIDEEVEETEMEPIKFDEKFSFGAAAAPALKGLDPNARVHFFENVPRNAQANARSGSASSESSLGPSTPPSYSDDGSLASKPTPILLKESDFRAKHGKAIKVGTPRRSSSYRRGSKKVQTGGNILRVQTIGGREIVVESSYGGDEVPFDYAIDLEKGVADIDISQHGAVDGSF
ncbi:hypothetical protein SCHPADRAFT_894380 [Schizopora paradoxa]|uniref:Serine hydrolase domain-containing protein n=1 Tax=Schizopora paradoxa TaxID=27342 RepID=A0A0H2R7D8_9AGAM|nr:hypothetical protein SCHPADRAFT_894380 [Schizopora paradoxa]